MELHAISMRRRSWSPSRSHIGKLSVRDWRRDKLVDCSHGGGGTPPRLSTDKGRDNSARELGKVFHLEEGSVAKPKLPMMNTSSSDIFFNSLRFCGGMLSTKNISEIMAKGRSNSIALIRGRVLKSQFNATIGLSISNVSPQQKRSDG